jgi:hypothetical protein
LLMLWGFVPMIVGRLFYKAGMRYVQKSETDHEDRIDGERVAL